MTLKWFCTSNALKQACVFCATISVVCGWKPMLLVKARVDWAVELQLSGISAAEAQLA